MSPTILSRGELGLRPPRSAPTGLTVAGTGLHYSGGLGDAKADHSLCDDVWRGFQNMHMSRGGLGTVDGANDLAYNFGACLHGYVLEGRGWDIRSAAFGSNECNGSLLAVCALGGDTRGRQDATPEQRAAIRWLFEENERRHPNARSVRRGHRDCHSTACPGDEWYEWLQAGMPLDGAPADPAPVPPAPAPAKNFPRPVPYPFPAHTVFRYPPMGRRSDVVKDWQAGMAERGWKIAADGWYGEESTGVAHDFQVEKHLGIDGDLGPETWAHTFSEPVT